MDSCGVARRKDYDVLLHPLWGAEHVADPACLQRAIVADAATSRDVFAPTAEDRNRCLSEDAGSARRCSDRYRDHDMRRYK